MGKKNRDISRANQALQDCRLYLIEVQSPIVAHNTCPGMASVSSEVARLLRIDSLPIEKRRRILHVSDALKERGLIPGKPRQKQVQNLPKKQRITARKPAAPFSITQKTKEQIFAEWVNSDAFLQSYEWRKVRYQALLRSKGKCEACGAGKEQGAVLNVDHIKPRRHYPHLALDLENLQVLDSPCNHGKGNWDETDWRGPSAA